MSQPEIFLSYAGEDGFEAALLQLCLERVLEDLNVRVWTYERDQSGTERSVASGLRDRMRDSVAAIILISPHTLDGGATQWMELAYADAFGRPTFLLLHHLTYDQLKKSERGVPPLVLQGQCVPARDWRTLEGELRSACAPPPAKGNDAL